MYKQIVIILLLSGYFSAQKNAGTARGESESLVSTEDSSPIPNTEQDLPVFTGRPGARRQITHVFSGPVITGIIFAVMLGIILSILSIVFLIRFLTKRRSLPPQHSSPENADSQDA